ncbi:MAG: hypothetical protein IJP56_03075 [Synergistaceae bacterium]|nr:hypothetical protein [Synergistaceae bacterium]MBQ6909458.1 hypothetical protein [Synergistaceae bacterium]MBR0043799.1 hypothetical protein [Synergistaceae bacterium]MBR0095691.1 hypothetical protein [Synergistaceae bacterium]
MTFKKVEIHALTTGLISITLDAVTTSGHTRDATNINLLPACHIEEAC